MGVMDGNYSDDLLIERLYLLEIHGGMASTKYVSVKGISYFPDGKGMIKAPVFPSPFCKIF